MTLLLTVDNIKSLIQKIGIHPFYELLFKQLTQDFTDWDQFKPYPRHVTHYPHGVIELMPISKNDFYAFKLVNGHPNNPDQQKLTVAAVGMLSDVPTGYPQLFCEMTLLTAFRTSAVAALAAKYLAVNNPTRIAIIGTGAQSEFLALAHQAATGCTHFNYFDHDAHAMNKFSKNLAPYNLKLTACNSVEQAIDNCQVIITATAAKKQNTILSAKHLTPGIHINALGGDCMGKTELDPAILKQCTIVVELLEQTQQEGEIQNTIDAPIHAELWEIITGKKPGRTSDQEITLFDSVGFALEDYSILKLIFNLAKEHQLGQTLDMIPNTKDPKDLFESLMN